MPQNVLAVDHRHDAVQKELALECIVQLLLPPSATPQTVHASRADVACPENRCDSCGVREAVRFDENVLEAILLPPDEVLHRRDKVVSTRVSSPH
jgi:hypothetical protein